MARKQSNLEKSLKTQLSYIDTMELSVSKSGKSATFGPMYWTSSSLNFPVDEDDAREQAKQFLLNSLEKEQKRLDDLEFLKETYKKEKDFLEEIHLNQYLEFQAMPVEDFNNKDSIKIYKSPIYNGKQSSEYRLLLIDDEPAFARKSNHWGEFTTNIIAGSEDAILAGLQDAIPDHYGRVGYKEHFWNLNGGNNKSSKSQAGYILLKDIQ